jgi:hypothetical protein
MIKSHNKAIKKLQNIIAKKHKKLLELKKRKLYPVVISKKEKEIFAEKKRRLIIITYGSTFSEKQNDFTVKKMLNNPEEYSLDKVKKIFKVA